MPNGGADIGGTTTKLAIIEPAGGVVDLRSMPTNDGEAPGLVRRIAAIVREAGWRLDAIGVGVAGFLDPTHEFLAYNPNLPWLERYPLRKELEQALGVPVSLEVDSNASTVAEWRFGAGRGAGRFLCLTAGTGLGGGMIVDGQILRFAYECLGDVGHVIVQPGGRRCSCGGSGCTEAFVGADAITEQYREAGGEARDLRVIIERASAGEQLARDVIRQAGYWLGLSLATLANILFPDRIAIAGGLSEAGEVLLAPCREAFRSNASPFAWRRATVARAELGWRATLIGAGVCGVAAMCGAAGESDTNVP